MPPYVHETASDESVQEINEESDQESVKELSEIVESIESPKLAPKKEKQTQTKPTKQTTQIQQNDPEETLKVEPTLTESQYSTPSLAIHYNQPQPTQESEIKLISSVKANGQTKNVVSIQKSGLREMIRVAVSRT